MVPPSAPSRFAVARPMPCPAPVTMQTLPFSRRAAGRARIELGHACAQIEVCGTPSRTVRSSRLASANGTSTGSTKVAERTRCAAGVECPAAARLSASSRARLQQPMPRHDDGVVGGDEVFLRAVLDRPHAFLHRGVLHGDAAHAAIGLAALLRRAIHHVVVVLVDDRPERAGDPARTWMPPPLRITSSSMSESGRVG